MQRSFKKLGYGLADAEIAFNNKLKEIHHMSDDTTSKVIAYYVKHRLVKFDALHGSYHVKHGAYLDKSTIEHCESLVK